MFTRKQLITVLLLVVLAAAFRIAIVHYLPNDTTDDSLGYEQIARNVLERHVYTNYAEPPYTPTLVRLPGYPLFLAAIYSVFGHTNNTAVRIVQALLDTGTCLLVAVLAGMLASTLQRGSFRIDWRPRPEWLLNAAGGALMGFGTALAPGGNDALVLYGIPILSPYALPTYAALGLGVALGLVPVAGKRRAEPGLDLVPEAFLELRVAPET